MFETFDLPFVQRGLWELLALSVAAGLLGTWIVLRGLAFYSHAVGTAAFPGLVLADGLGFPAVLGALGTAGVVAVLVALLARRDREGYDAVTAIVLVGALAAGVILASDVFGSGADVDALLFGSLLVLDGGDVALAVVAAVVVLVATLMLGERWLAVGFDEGAARAQGLRSGGYDAVLLALVAGVAVTSLGAIGALLTTALLVVPAATTRLLVDRLGLWQLATVGLLAVEGTVGLWLSVELNAPPGATIAALSGAVFVLAVVIRMVRPRRAVALAAAATLSAGLAACGDDSGGTAGEGKARVVASTTHLADIARAVGGDRVTVTGLLKPNSDPHDYEPRPDDVRAIAQADRVLLSGLGLDGWADEIVDKNNALSGFHVGDDVPVKSGGAAEHGDEHGDEHEGDPHWWQDPRNIAAAAKLIARELDVDQRPEVATYVARVRALDDAAARCMRAIPEAERKIVTDHDAFGYLARRYDIEVVGTVIPSLTSQAQPSAGDLAQLARTIRHEHVKAVFPETQLEPRLARAIAQRTGASSDFRLYSDALGPRGSDGDTVLKAFAHNVRELVRGMTDGRSSCALP